MKKLLWNACIGVALLTVLVAAGVAQAAPAAEPAAPSTRFRYDDLNLDQPGDARAMLKRIRHAAAAVCRASPFAGSTDIEAIERFDACYRQAVGRAVTQLDAPQVTALFEAKPADRKLARLP